MALYLNSKSERRTLTGRSSPSDITDFLSLRRYGRRT
uniref:Uncharacterized protein n=1 Tax=Anguilla anguilla TaxID=7936 RepID=A0A0E9QH76_ANGAN